MPTMTVDGYELSYAESGAGDPLVLVHGTLGDQRYWAPQMATLGQALPGAGAVDAALLAGRCGPTRAATSPSTGMSPTWPPSSAASASGRCGWSAIRAAGISPSAWRSGTRSWSAPWCWPSRAASWTRAWAASPPRRGQAGAFAEGAALIEAGDTEGGLRRIAEHTGGPGAWEKRSETRKAIGRANARTLLGQRQRAAEALFPRGGGADRGADAAGGGRPDHAEFRRQRGCAGAAHQGLRAGEDPERRAFDEPGQPGRLRRRGAGLPGARTDDPQRPRHRRQRQGRPGDHPRADGAWLRGDERGYRARRPEPLVPLS